MRSERGSGRELNKRATRRALRVATLELGLERGLADVPIEEIARRAGVSPRTFFNYFDVKEDAALVELFLVTDDELSVLAAGDGPLWADLCRMFVADVERAERDGPDLPRYLQLHARHPALQARQLAFFAAFVRKLTDAVAARSGTGLRAALMAGSCITAVRVGLDQWMAQDHGTPAGTHVAAAFAELDPAFGENAATAEDRS